ncbi:MAG: hypothetical protein GXX94_00085 [Chloroflexi bacterium]|nr:hypothetical protein [Chloroflexota bacterium]
MERTDDLKGLYENAHRFVSAGEYGLAIEVYSTLFQELTAEDAKAARGGPETIELLSATANELVELLRWERRYEQAIDTQERLGRLFPASASGMRLSLANLKLEAGESAYALGELKEIAKENPRNIWGWLALASAHMWLADYEDAEKLLKRAAELPEVEEADLAEAHRQLFALYSVQGRVDDAMAAWERACALDPSLVEMRPEVIRMLVHYRHWNRAGELVDQETCEVRKLFYSGLIYIHEGLGGAAYGAWDQLMDTYDPDALTEGRDEYAEGALHSIRPQHALKALGPLIGVRDATRHRMLLAGLAWAQLRVINRAEGCLDVALRMADLERPRRTRPNGEYRILDAASRILYATVIIDQDVRARLDHYFIPNKRQEAGHTPGGSD